MNATCNSLEVVAARMLMNRKGTSASACQESVSNPSTNQQARTATKDWILSSNTIQIQIGVHDLREREVSSIAEQIERRNGEKELGKGDKLWT